MPDLSHIHGHLGILLRYRASLGHHEPSFIVRHVRVLGKAQQDLLRWFLEVEHENVGWDFLANVLEDRYYKLGNLVDLERAVELHTEALSLRPTGHGDRSISLNNLAKVICTQIRSCIFFLHHHGSTFDNSTQK